MTFRILIEIHIEIIDIKLSYILLDEIIVIINIDIIINIDGAFVHLLLHHHLLHVLHMDHVKLSSLFLQIH